MEFLTLDIATPNLLMQASKTPSARLAVVFPGIGYTTAMPALYYPALAAINLGYDVLRVDYTYHDVPIDQVLPRMQTDVPPALAAALELAARTELLLIGKSLGTIAMADRLQAGLPLPTRFAWITPLNRQPAIRMAMETTAPTSFVAIGDRDPQYDPAFLTHINGRGANVHVVPGADHSLLLPTEVSGAVHAMASLVRTWEGWLAATPG